MATARASLITPLTGSLAVFGRASADALRLWAAEAAELPTPFSGVDLTVHDCHPNPRNVIAAASRDSHLIFGPYGTHFAASAIASTERLVWNHGGAGSRLSWPRFPNVINVLSPARSYFEGFLRLLRRTDAVAKTVTLFHAETRFGKEVAEGAVRGAEVLGYRIERVGFRPGKAKASVVELPQAELLLVAGGFDDEQEAARVLLRREWKAAAFVGAGEQGVLEGLGQDAEGLMGPTQWIATAPVEPDEGPSPEWFVREFRTRTGEEPSYPAAQAFAAGLLAGRCAREAGSLEDGGLLEAARSLRCRTLYGEFRIDPHSGSQVGHSVLTVQWRRGRRVIVDPPELADAAVRYPRRARAPVP